MPATETEGPVRKVLPIFYVLDTSGSMSGARITAVNNAMGETIRVLQKVGAKNTQAEIKVAALTFDSQITWVTNGLEELEDFFWNDVNANGLTKLGGAIDELATRMSRKDLMQSDVGFKLPIIIFMSDGAPNDDYQSALAKANANNKWFKNSTKIAIAIGDDADRNVLAEVTGSIESVIAVNDLDTLEQLIVVLSATVSKIGSVSIVGGVGDANKAVIDTLSNFDGAASGIDLTKPVATLASDADPFGANANTATPDDTDWPTDDWD